MGQCQSQSNPGACHWQPQHEWHGKHGWHGHRHGNWGHHAGWRHGNRWRKRHNNDGAAIAAAVTALLGVASAVAQWLAAAAAETPAEPHGATTNAQRRELPPALPLAMPIDKPIPLGSHVQLLGLRQNAQYNERTGTVVRLRQDQRVSVQLDGEQQRVVAVRLQNVQLRFSPAMAVAEAAVPVMPSAPPLQLPLASAPELHEIVDDELPVALAMSPMSVVPASYRHRRAVEVLCEMGFYDTARTMQLLDQHDGDLPHVARALLAHA